MIYFNFDHLARVSPFITDKAGKPMDKNPLLDVRVRRAISKAINRQAIAERVMEGQAIPSGQLVSDKLFGHVPGLKPDAFDPEGAKKCQGENPDAVVLQIHIIDPAICEHRPCKNPACACPQRYRLPLAEQKNRDSFHWQYTRW